VLAVLPKRFERFGLKLRPEKTRLVEFKAQPSRSRKSEKDDDNNQRPPRKFDFLGFTHIWGHTLKGKPIVKRSTASNRLTRLRALERKIGYFRP